VPRVSAAGAQIAEDDVGYGAIEALRAASFSVAAGEIPGIIGPNGSGKTTLFNCILGQATPSGGHVADG
jgi:branched-chain amino acid transport system ATP-binding protein